MSSINTLNRMIASSLCHRMVGWMGQGWLGDLQPRRTIEARRVSGGRLSTQGKEAWNVVVLDYDLYNF
jgi:hypothetical protein